MTARVFLSFASAAAAERTHFTLGYACASLLLPYSEGEGGGGRKPVIQSHKEDGFPQGRVNTVTS